jgi:polar amino acid transport system permease protein
LITFPTPRTDPLWVRNVGLAAAVALLLWVGIDDAMAQIQRNTDPSIWNALLRWTPLIFRGSGNEIGGFVLNVFVSVVAMAIGTILGVLVGIARISRSSIVRRASWGITQLFLNSPMLVLLFYFMLLLPYQADIAGVRIAFPGWLKASIGLSLPIMANIAEITRGAIASIPTVQWEAAESLAFTRRQTMWRIILPQCVKRMIPPWMNWYCILMMSTPLISILGLQDSMALTQDALTSEGRQDLLIPFYLWLMVWFFVYIYPLARLTRQLELRFALKS